MTTKKGPSQCPRCGGELEHNKKVERPVREGNDVAIVLVRADVCTRCGELLLHPGMTDRLTKIKLELRKGIKGPAVGNVYDMRAAV